MILWWSQYLIVALFLWLPHAFLANWFINSFCSHIVFERSTGERWRNLYRTSSDSWNKLPGYSQLKDKKNSLLRINNYLLKHKSVTIIYIYICVCVCVEIVSFFCCTWETDKWDIWLVQSFYVIQFFREWIFCRKGFSCGRNFFSYSPVFDMDIGYLLSLNPKNIYFYIGFLWNKHSWLANQSQIISYSSSF